MHTDTLKYRYTENRSSSRSQFSWVNPYTFTHTLQVFNVKLKPDGEKEWLRVGLRVRVRLSWRLGRRGKTLGAGGP